MMMKKITTKGEIMLKTKRKLYKELQEAQNKIERYKKQIGKMEKTINELQEKRSKYPGYF
jgi:predicted nuclease with TOPRIM domain